MQNFFVFLLHELNKFFFEAAHVFIRNLVEISICCSKNNNDLVLNSNWHVLTLLQNFNKSTASRTTGAGSPTLSSKLRVPRSSFENSSTLLMSRESRSVSALIEP